MALPSFSEPQYLEFDPTPRAAGVVRRPQASEEWCDGCRGIGRPWCQLALLWGNRGYPAGADCCIVVSQRYVKHNPTAFSSPCVGRCSPPVAYHNPDLSTQINKQQATIWQALQAAWDLFFPHCWQMVMYFSTFVKSFSWSSHVLQLTKVAMYSSLMHWSVFWKTSFLICRYVWLLAEPITCEQIRHWSSAIV